MGEGRWAGESMGWTGEAEGGECEAGKRAAGDGLLGGALAANVRLARGRQGMACWGRSE